MSNRARVASILASAGILAGGWAVGTVQSDAKVQLSGSGDATRTTTQSATSVPSTTPSSAAPSTAAAAPAPTGGALTDGTYQGQSVTYRYGQLSVSLVVSGGVIENATASVTSDGERRSETINQRAIPLLEQEVVQADSASVSSIGGATYTSEAYLRSLQSALDKANA